MKGAKLTYQDYLKLPEEERYELIEGELLPMPSPTSKHQRVVLKLSVALHLFVEKHGLGLVYPAPFDVVLDEENVLQPDILFLSKENLSKLQERGIFGAPDLVVEVISPSTAKRDLEVKRSLYERYGVKELWFVFPEEQAVEVLFLEGGRYFLHDMKAQEGKACSRLLEGFCVELREVFN
ncbi:MAG: Uma2 family endonuclease [Aquificota bacterium]|nr:MAG: Uma2 family endonuclease [Aquificota bacterium]